MLYLGIVEKSPVSPNCNLPYGIVFMVDIWKAYIHDDEVGTLGFLILEL